jgi:tubulin polyglutamylase TTLL5
MADDEPDSVDGFLSSYPVSFFEFQWEDGKLVQPSSSEQPKYARIGYAARLLHRVLHLSGFREISAREITDANLILGTLDNGAARTLTPVQRVTHFDHTFSLGSKSGFHKVITGLVDRTGDRSAVSFYPESYLLPRDYDRLVGAFQTGAGLWITKPGGGARGEGISVISEIPTPTVSDRIVQHYIANPMLINDLKFDLRFYVSVMSLDPLRIYVHENGLVRFGTESYSSNVADLSNQSAHLTNFSINRKNPRFVATEDPAHDGLGSQWTHRPFWEFLLQSGRDPEAIRRQIDDHLVTTIIAARDVFLTQKDHRRSFEVFGFDIMLDADANVYILEVNVTPALGTSSGLDLLVKGPLVRDFFNIALVPKPGEAASKVEGLFLTDDDNVDVVAICEFEIAARRAGGFRCIYPTPDRITTHGPLLARKTKLDEVLETWIRHNQDKKMAFMKERYAGVLVALGLGADANLQ